MTREGQVTGTLQSHSDQRLKVGYGRILLKNSKQGFSEAWRNLHRSEIVEYEVIVKVYFFIPTSLFARK